MSKKIYLDDPCIGELEKKYLCEAIDSGFVSSVGPFVKQFEQKMADYLGVPSAVAVQSGTAAIHMALHELGIGPGDEVIVPALTFAATVNPVLYVGANPVIVDVDSKTWNIDPDKIKKAVTEKTRAIIPVHLYGNPCNMTEIMQIAEEHGLHIIEDATESLGATFQNKPTGTFGNFGCFSFNGNKLITTGGGGLIVGRDQKKMDHIRYLINQAKDSDRPGFHSEMGFNYRMTNIEAALGLAQLERLQEFIEKKKRIFSIYEEFLSDKIDFQQEEAGGSSSRWFSAGWVNGQKDVTAGVMKEYGLLVRDIFIPLTQMPYFKKYSVHCSISDKIYNHALCLPGSTMNDEKVIKEAVVAIREVLND
ncbi:MAG: aminotransferase class I/II-fold pyridoxal phosphate-dependent enzyme [Candidatus Omnitrophica bacterium]|nr:aminotransferase class I/II-fold pyridoxal phosphate-dependent enzyme [Candidatus Omnitrophota bacterium]